MRLSRRGLGLGTAALAAAITGCEEPAPPPATPSAARSRIGRTTYEVLELARALADGGVRAEPGPDSGGLGAMTDALHSSTATIGSLAVEQKLRLHEAEHGRTPATYEEFMKWIIAPGTPDAVALPLLPSYQRWAYDPETRGLVVVEYPALKERRLEEAAGRSDP